jgi:hypothetical protein
MRSTALICVCCLVIGVAAAWGQAANTQARQQGILGILDPQTGAFRALPAVTEDTELAPAAVFNGTVNLTLNITLRTTALTTFTCMLQVSTFDGSTIFTETDTVSATGSGTTRTCKLSIPYAWSLNSQATDKMTTSYSVFGSGGATSLIQRTSSRNPLDVRAVPANGAITTLTAAVVQ